MYTIISSILNDKDLYVFYDKFGSVLLVHYHFTGSSTFGKHETLIGAYLSSGGFGPLHNQFRHIKIKDKMYFLLSAGQRFTDKQHGFYSLDLTTSELKKIRFDEQPRVVVAVHLEDTDMLDQIAYEFLPEKELEQVLEKVSRTKMFLEKPYYFYEVSSEEEQRDKELDEILSVWLMQKYSLFEIPSGETSRESDDSVCHDLPDSKERRRVEEFIGEVLRFTGSKTGSRFRIQDYLYTGTPESVDMYYFFYTDHQNRVKIIRYDLYHTLWYIGDFDETGFEPQIDIYRATDVE